MLAHWKASQTTEKYWILRAQLLRIDLHHRMIFLHKMHQLNKKLRDRRKDYFNRVKILQSRIQNELIVIERSEEIKFYAKFNAMKSKLERQDSAKRRHLTKLENEIKRLHNNGIYIYEEQDTRSPLL